MQRISENHIFIFRCTNVVRVRDTLFASSLLDKRHTLIFQISRVQFSIVSRTKMETPTTPSSMMAAELCKHSTHAYLHCKHCICISFMLARDNQLISRIIFCFFVAGFLAFSSVGFVCFTCLCYCRRSAELVQLTPSRKSKCEKHHGKNIYRIIKIQLFLHLSLRRCIHNFRIFVDSEVCVCVFVLRSRCIRLAPFLSRE